MHPLLQSKGKKPRTGSVIRCPGCQSEFYVAQSELTRRVYCSRDCQAKAAENRVERTCPGCGKLFSRPLSQNHTHCSQACYTMGRQREPGKCQRCGNPLKVNAKRFCSPECFKLGIRRGEDRPCQQCGKAIYVSPALAGTKRFCSRECKAASLRFDGPGHTCKRSDGYLQTYYPTHPDASSQGFILQHRLVAEGMIGRRLARNEHVHHINQDRADNRPENLQVIDAGVHGRISIAQGVKKRRRMRDELEEYRRRFGPLNEPKPEE